jgi:drug/metabolite transporter (DMT)-like permease
MNTSRRRAVAALVAAGVLWGTTVPLSKLALAWLPAGWLTAMRFGLAAPVLLALASRNRRRLRAAFTPAVLASGAIGYGGSVVVQNAGITRTSVTHAALLIGAVPVLVAVIAAVWHRTVARPVAWAGFALSLAGVGLVTAGGGGGGATPVGDGLVLASVLVSATFTVGQARLLPGRDPAAVTGVQFLGAALASLLFSVFAEGAPAAPTAAGPVLAVVALAACGTLLPFTLFAHAQSRVSAEVAGAFLNLEPLVGALAGAVVFGDPVGIGQVGGGAAILVGIGLSSLPLLAGRKPRVAPTFAPVDEEPLAHESGKPLAPVSEELRAHGRDNLRKRVRTLPQPWHLAPPTSGRNVRNVGVCGAELRSGGRAGRRGSGIGGRGSGMGGRGSGAARRAGRRGSGIGGRGSGVRGRAGRRGSGVSHRGSGQDGREHWRLAA